MTVPPARAASQPARMPALKFLVIAMLTLVMSVPLFFVWIALAERQDRQADAARDIAMSWGGAQTISGPVLIVPYTVIERREDARGQITESEVLRFAQFLPAALAIEGATETETRSRGLFDVTVYTGRLTLSGRFARPDFAAVGDTPARILWADAAVAVWIADVRAIASNTALTWNGQDVAFKPGLPAGRQGGAIHAPVAGADMMDQATFAFSLDLRGSEQLQFTPVAEDTAVRLASTWPHPSFGGAFLPVARDIGPAGFTAAWEVPYLARPFPQVTFGDALYDPSADHAFGVRFIQPVDFYALVDRALKYAILFVGLGFLSVFLIETALGTRVHAVQYILIGSAQVVFYLLLLALSEHAGFDQAYAAAAGATVILTTLYAIWALGGLFRALLVFVVKAVLYGVLFVLINQEDRALLIGALLVFTALAITMLATRNVDWYAIGPKDPAPH